MPSVRIVIGGDTYFGEFYQSRREKAGKINYLCSRGYSYSFRGVAPLLERADCVIVNLECALTKQAHSELEGRKGWILAGDPIETVAALREANVSAAMLGNNHAKDYGSATLLKTIEHLEAGGIFAFGAGANCREAQTPFVRAFEFPASAFKLAIISGFYFNEFHERLGFYARADRCGVNELDVDHIRNQIAGLKRGGYFVIVSPHWGQNYFLRNYRQTSLAKGLVAAGADLIVGHGPHLLNEFFQNGVWVVYSLGNLVFNSEGEYAARQVFPYSLILELVVKQEGLGYGLAMNLYPIVSCNQMTEFQPRFVDEREFEQIAMALRALRYDPDVFDKSVQQQQIDGRLCFSVPVGVAPLSGQ